MNRFRFVSLFVTVLFALTTYAQSNNNPIRADLDAMFSFLEKDRVPTGLLRDNAVEEVDFGLYNGYNNHDTTAVSFVSFKRILGSIRSASVRTISPCCHPDTLASNMVSTFVEGSVVPVGIAAFKYNYIVENALTDSLLVYEENTGQVLDRYQNDSIWVNPYGEALLVGFSPFVNVTNSRIFSYYFDEAFIQTNLSIAYLEFDPGDGSGFRQIALNSSVSANYSFFTSYYLQLKIHLTSGVVLTGKSYVSICDGIHQYNHAPSVLLGEPDYYFSITGHDNSQEADALVSVKYANSRQGTSTLLRPFIIAEGIDPFSSLFYRNRPFYAQLGANNIETACRAITGLYQSDYDVVYIDWRNSNASIQTNADIVRQVIEWVNNNKEDSSIPNIVMGESMGGLAVRYALCKMEQQGYHHQVSTYISCDSPHLGANVPLGFFYAARYFYPQIESLYSNVEAMASNLSQLGIADYDTSEIRLILNEFSLLMDAYSTKQMSYNYVQNDFAINNQIHTAWQQELNQIGFPHGDGETDFAMITSSNGGYNQSYFALESFFDVYGTMDLAAGSVFFANVLMGDVESAIWSVLFPRANYYSIHLTIFPFVEHVYPVFRCLIDYHKSFLWIPSKTISIANELRWAPLSSYPLDKAKSSYFTPGTKSLESIQSFTNGHFLIGHADLDISIERDTLAGFIPTVSSLCIGKGLREPTDSEYQEDFSGGYNYFFDRTPFNSYFVNSSSSYHTSYMNGMFSWIQEMDTLRVIGPSTAVTWNFYRLTNPLLDPNWVSSDSSVATVDPFSGEVTVQSQGEFTVSCVGTGMNGRPFHFDKNVRTAVFDYTLSSSSPSGPMSSKPFEVRANSPTWDHTCGVPPFAVLNNTSGHRFFFSIHLVGSNAPITWAESDMGPEAFLVVPEGSSTVVSFKAEYYGAYSDVQTVLCDNLLEMPSFPIDDGGEIGPVPGGDDPIGPDPDPNPDPGPEGSTPPFPSGVTFVIGGEEFTYSEMPTPRRLLEDMKGIASIRKKLDSVKPKGNRDFLLIPCQLTDKESGKKYDRFVKFIYKGK